LEKFAEALSLLLPLDRSLPLLSSLYDDEYSRAYFSLMRRKLGLREGGAEGGKEEEELVEKLFKTMEETAADFTMTFVELSRLGRDGRNKEEVREGGREGGREAGREGGLTDQEEEGERRRPGLSPLVPMSPSLLPFLPPLLPLSRPSTQVIKALASHCAPPSVLAASLTKKLRISRPTM
jgi:hypothetical protein